MFRPEPMLRLNAVILARDVRDVLRELGRGDIIELRRTETEDCVAADCRIGLSRCDRLINRIAEMRRQLQRSPPMPLSPGNGSQRIDFSAAEERLRGIEEQIASWMDRKKSLLLTQAEAAAVCDTMTGFENVELPLDLEGRAEFLHFVIGTLPAKNLQPLRDELGASAVLFAPPARGDGQTVVALTTRGRRQALDSTLARAAFCKESLPELVGATTASFSNDKRIEKEEARLELEKLDAECLKFSAEVAPALDAMEAAAIGERRMFEAEQNLARTESTALLIGWLTADQSSRVEQRLREMTNGNCAISFTMPEEIPEDEIPIVLKQPRWLRPFAMLVTAYGFPKYRELEPTLFLAISYVLMFGLMFGDAGQGALLALAGLFAFRIGKQMTSDKGQMTTSVGLLFLYAGVSSAIFGVVYGSYFGLPQFKHLALWHDPLEGDPLRLMYAAIGIGIAVISIGLALNIANRFRRGDFLGGLLDKFGIAGVVFYWGALGLLAKSAALQSRGMLAWAVVLVLGLPVAGWILREPLQCLRGDSHGGRRIGTAIIESAVEAFEGVLAYLANTISFVRLAAYAMSHAALLMAFFMMAESVHRASAIGSVAVIVLGNVIAIVLEGVIAAVQAMRLEYYEFFGKFFSGAGRPFRPLRL